VGNRIASLVSRAVRGLPWGRSLDSLVKTLQPPHFTNRYDAGRGGAGNNRDVYVSRLFRARRGRMWAGRERKQMPRFGIKSLLILFAIVGLWLSTFSKYPGSQDIQAIVRLLVFLTAALSALFYRGRRQAFWIGFFATMLIFTFEFPGDIVPVAVLIYRAVQQSDRTGILLGCVAMLFFVVAAVEIWRAEKLQVQSDTFN
jgi:hypothetical protein